MYLEVWGNPRRIKRVNHIKRSVARAVLALLCGPCSWGRQTCLADASASSVRPPQQCLRPSCDVPAREGQQYCSDACVSQHALERLMSGTSTSGSDAKDAKAKPEATGAKPRPPPKARRDRSAPGRRTKSTNEVCSGATSALASPRHPGRASPETLSRQPRHHRHSLLPDAPQPSAKATEQQDRQAEKLMMARHRVRSNLLECIEVRWETLVPVFVLPRGAEGVL